MFFATAGLLVLVILYFTLMSAAHQRRSKPEPKPQVEGNTREQQAG